MRLKTQTSPPQNTMHARSSSPPPVRLDLSSLSRKMSPSGSHLFKTVPQELCPSGGRSRHIAADGRHPFGVRRTTTAEEAQGTPTQSHVSPRILVCMFIVGVRLYLEGRRVVCRPFLKLTLLGLWHRSVNLAGKRLTPRRSAVARRVTSESNISRMTRRSTTSLFL